MSKGEYLIEVTGPDGRKFTARGLHCRVMVESQPVEITSAGILGGPPDMGRRFTAGPQTIKIEMSVIGQVDVSGVASKG